MIQLDSEVNIHSKPYEFFRFARWSNTIDNAWAINECDKQQLSNNSGEYIFAIPLILYWSMYNAGLPSVKHVFPDITDFCYKSVIVS